MIGKLIDCYDKNTIAGTTEGWAWAVCEPMHDGWTGRLKDAWMIFTGKITVIERPSGADLEKLMQKLKRKS